LSLYDLAKPEETYEIRFRTPLQSATCCCCSQFCKLPGPLPGSFSLPYWADYDAQEHYLISRIPVPINFAGQNFCIQILNGAGVILGECSLEIVSKQNNLLMMTRGSLPSPSVGSDEKSPSSTTITNPNKSANEIEVEMWTNNETLLT